MKHRCPKGSRRNKAGDCIKTHHVSLKKSSSLKIPTSPLIQKTPTSVHNITPIVPIPSHPKTPSPPPLPSPVAIKKKKRCPKGTQKNTTGDCIKTHKSPSLSPPPQPKTPSPSPPPQPKTPSFSPPPLPSSVAAKKKKRCPKGTHKNTTGDCIKTHKSAISKPKTFTPVHAKKPSTVRIASDRTPSHYSSPVFLSSPGLPPKTRVILSSSSSPTTSRGIYAKKYHTNDIFLSDTDINNNNQNILLQFTFNNVGQFEDFVPLSKTPIVDCVYQTLFALGLRRTKLLKLEAAEVNEKSDLGVSFFEMSRLFAVSFNIDESNVSFTQQPTWPDDKSVAIYMKQFFIDRLKNNHASIFVILFNKIKGVGGFGHAIISYKYNNKVYFFDPQNKKSYDKKQTISENILDITKKYKAGPKMRLSSFLYFTVSNLEQPMKLIEKDWSVDYVPR
jgi:hypothetical protein